MLTIKISSKPIRLGQAITQVMISGLAGLSVVADPAEADRFRPVGLGGQTGPPRVCV
jgi:hypothetical protein